MVEINESAASMLRAVLAMGVLTLAMLLWMYARRLPAMQRAGFDPQSAMHTRDIPEPSEVRRVVDNYNHLFEAPTVFYAVSLAIVLLGLADPVHASCAWAYVAARVVHSLVQATFNRVMVRFFMFSLSWLALAVMIVRGVAGAF